jgi:hypothetical protein
MSGSRYGYFSDEKDQADDGIWGWDDDHLVGVCLEPDGEVRELSVSDSWRSSIQRDKLGAVIFASYSAAERARLDLAREKPAESATPVGGEIPEIPISLTQAVFAVQKDYVATYQESLEEVREFRDRDDNVRVSAWGGSVGRVEFDDEWLGFTSGAYIAAATLEPLSQAVRTGRAIDREMERRYPEITEFRRLRALKTAALGII